MKTREQHYVTFISPGTFLNETTTKEISEWSTREAVGMAESVVERYGAKPFGFVFETRLIADPIPDGRGGSMRVEPTVLRKSGVYFLGGKVETYEDIKHRADPKEEILRANMRANGHWIVVVSTNSFRSIQSFGPADVVVDATGAEIEQGADPKRVEYRAWCDKIRDEEYAGRW